MNKTYIYFLSIMLIGLLFACTEKVEDTIESSFEAPISPQNLAYGSNVLFMEDFVSDVQLIDSVFIDGIKMGFYQSKRQIVFQAADFKNPLLLMQIWINGKSKDILLKKSRKQKYMFSFNPQGKSYDSVQIVGEINGWTPSKTKLEWHDTSWQQVLFLEPGKYAYQVVADNKWMLDNNNSNIMPNGQGGENSVLHIGNNKMYDTPYLTTIQHSDDSIYFSVLNFQANQIFVLWNNQLINSDEKLDFENYYKTGIPKQASTFELSYIRIYAFNENGLSNDLLIPLMNGKVANSSDELPRTAWHTNIIYNVFVDRFYDGDPTNNNPLSDSIVLPQANYNGGDLKGIIQKINVGYFTELGVNSLWLSPVVKNTEGAYGYWPDPETKFSAYHGYWPTSFTQINPHFGNPQDLKDLVAVAHENQSNVLLDMVANHVHNEHPYYIEHPEYATKLELPDGSLNLERWDEHRLTTWFDKFLPTLDLERPEVAQMLADSAVWWAQEYNLDGFRYDAAKHIPLSFWRLLTKKLKDSVINRNSQSIYQLGETYGSSDLIGSYISNGLLDAQFDFNVYDAALGVFAGGNDINILAERLDESIRVYGGHNLMAYITGNQDRARFISYAGGTLRFDEDAKVAGWTRDVEIGDSLAFKKLQMLMALNMTIPGIPVIFYGDEFGMPGGNDPDCRRMMRFGDDLSDIEKQNLKVTKKLIELRKSNMALLYGDIVIHQNEGVDRMSYSRSYFNQFAWVGFNNSDKTKKFEFEISGELVSNFDSKIIKEGSKYIIEIPAYSFEILTMK